MSLRKSVLAILLLACVGGACHAADHDLRTQVMEPVQKFFDALGRQDKSGLLAVVAPDTDVTSMHEGKLRRLSIGSLADAIAAHRGGAIAERIYQPVVHVDDDLAVVWAPYRFTIDGRVDHCGTDVITLGRVEGHWLIIGLADNERKDGCQ